MYVCMYVYIYIYTERERDVAADRIHDAMAWYTTLLLRAARVEVALQYTAQGAWKTPLRCLREPVCDSLASNSAASSR